MVLPPTIEYVFLDKNRMGSIDFNSFAPLTTLYLDVSRNKLLFTSDQMIEMCSSRIIVKIEGSSICDNAWRNGLYRPLITSNEEIYSVPCDTPLLNRCLRAVLKV
jgi:hypothetical protein